MRDEEGKIRETLQYWFQFINRLGDTVMLWTVPRTVHCTIFGPPRTNRAIQMLESNPAIQTLETNSANP